VELQIYFVWFPLVRQIRYKHTSNRRVYMASIKETIYLKIKCMRVTYMGTCLKITQLNLAKISEIVFKDIRKVERVSSLNHVKK